MSVIYFTYISHKLYGWISNKFSAGDFGRFEAWRCELCYDIVACHLKLKVLFKFVAIKVVLYIFFLFAI